MRPSLALIVAFSLAACGTDPSDDDSTVGPTWYQDVAPVAAEHCMGCHQPGGIAPFSMMDYAIAKEHASEMAFETSERRMPPWDAVEADDCTPRHGWRDDPRLTQAEIDLFGEWSRNGAPSGELADIPDPPTTNLDGITHTVTPDQPFAPSGDYDQFICYLLDPGVTQLQYMTGAQLTPGNPKVVHHAVTWVFPPGSDLDAQVLANGVGAPFECQGGATSAAAYLLNVWTPGQLPLETPSELGIPVAAGSMLMVQFHYHPGGVENDPDATRIDLRLTSEKPAKLYTIGAWGNAFQAPELLPGEDDVGGSPVFYIPADAPDHAEDMRFQVVTQSAQRFPLFAAYPHMHYLGIELKVHIARATPGPNEPAEECLVNVDRWNFDWQRTYQYDAPIDELPTVGNGDIVDIHCTYDNTMDNPYVARALEEAHLTDPVDVVLGEETLDEMCLGIFGIVYDAPAAKPAFEMVPLPGGAAP